MRQQSQDVTTKIYKWIIQRTDGVGFACSNHDKRIHMGATVLEPNVDLRPSEIILHDDMLSSSFSILGSSNDTIFSEGAILSGRWKGARLRLQLADWIERTARSTICEGVLSKLQAERGELAITVDLLPEEARRPACAQTSPECRAVLGDGHCRVDMRTRKQRVIVSAISEIGVSVDGAELQRYAMGRLRWTSGKDCGLEQKIIGVSDQQLLLHDPFNCNAVIGDTAIVTEGCDGRRETCSQRFENVLNFRGEPDLPGSEILLRYPGA